MIVPNANRKVDEKWINIFWEDMNFTDQHGKHKQTWCFKPQQLVNVDVDLSCSILLPRSSGFNGPISMAPNQCLDSPLLWMVKIHPYQALSIHTFQLKPQFLILKPRSDHHSCWFHWFYPPSANLFRQELCGNEDVVLAAVKQNGMALQTPGWVGGSFEKDWWRKVV